MSARASKLPIAILVMLTAGPTALAQETLFRRSDANGDVQFDISDAAFTANYLFRGGPPPSCLNAADVNDDGHVDIADTVSTLQWLFLGVSSPPPPFPDLGPDPTEDSLSCGTYPSGEVVGQGSALSFSGPVSVAAVPGSVVEVPVAVRLAAHDSVQAWSFGVLASGGGGIASATTPDTIAPDYEVTEVVNSGQGAVSAVFLSFVQPVTLDPSGNPHMVLDLILEGVAPPADTSQSWALSFTDTLSGAGQPVDTVVTVDGLSYIPSQGAYQVEIVGIPEPSSLLLLSMGAAGLLVYAWRRRRGLRGNPWMSEE